MTTEEYQMIIGAVMLIVLLLILFGVFDPKDK
mgnify:FL=1